MRFFKFISVLIISIFIILSPVVAQQAKTTPKVAVVLSGGGAKGVAEVALLQVLEEEGIPIDMILGTSMGSLVGVFYACGYSAQEVNNILHEVDMMGAINENTSETMKGAKSPFDYHESNLANVHFTEKGLGSAPALLGDQKVFNTIAKYIRKKSYVTDFDELPIPYRAVATDIYTGEAKVFSSGSLLYAARASMSLPVIFTPTPTEDGSLAFDGCLSNNLPIETAREMGADYVIAMDVSSYNKIGTEDLANINSIAVHAFNLVVNPKSISQYKLADVIINADISEYSMMDYMLGDEILEAGYRAVEAQRSEIHELALKMEKAGVVLKNYDLDRVSEYTKADFPLIESVEIKDVSSFGEVPLPKESDFKAFIGKRLNDTELTKLEKKLDELRYSYNLSSLSYETRRGSTDDQYVLLICANHYEQKTDSILVGGNPSFELSKDIGSSTPHALLSTEMAIGLDLTRTVPLQFGINIGDEYSLKANYSPCTDRNDRVNVGFDLGGQLKGGSLEVKNSHYYKNSYNASDVGFDIHAAAKIFYVDYATTNIGLQYDCNFLDRDKSFYNLIWVYTGVVIDTLRNYTLGLNGYRIDSMVKGGLSFPLAPVYSLKFSVRQRFNIKEDISTIGYDVKVSVDKFPYRLKLGYGDYGGFDGMCGYGKGTLMKDFSLVGVTYQHKILSVADIPLYGIIQGKVGLKGQYEPFTANEESSVIPFYMEEFLPNFDAGAGAFIGIDSPIGNIIIGFSMAINRNYSFIIGIM